MVRKFPRDPFKMHAATWVYAHCKAILRPLGPSALAFVILITSACTPGTTQQIFNNYGADKKQQTDDPYSGTGGTGDGGGGQGILCSADAKNPALKSKLFVRDIFEAIYNSKLTIKELSASAQDPNQVTDEAIRFLIAALRTYFGPATANLDVGREQYWRDFVNGISFINEDATLYASQDANSPIALPGGCKIAQIAYWDDSVGEKDGGTLYVDQKQWQKLDQVNKVALLAHEYFFKQGRKAGLKNSDSVRGKIGRMFSTVGADPLFKNWDPSGDSRVRDILPASNDGFKFCVGKSKDDPSALMHMYQYLGKDKQQHFVFPLLTSAAINLFSLTNTEFTYSDPKHVVDAATNLLYFYEIDQVLMNVEREKSMTMFDHDAVYLGSGLLAFGDDDYEEDEFSNFAYQLTNQIGLLKDSGIKEVWKNNLRGTGGSIEIVLENPTTQSNKKTYSAERLMLMIQEQFVSNLKRQVFTNGPGAWNTEEDADVALMLSILRAEIEETKKVGKLEFPKWEKAYWAFVNEHTTIDEKNDQDPEKARYAAIADAFPVTMVRASLGYLSEDDIVKYGLWRDLDAKGFETFPKSRFLVNYQNNQVAFDMECDDYDLVYTDRINQSSPLLTAKAATSTSPKKINYALDIGKVDPFMMYKKETHELALERGPQLLKFLTTEALTNPSHFAGWCNDDADPSEDGCTFIKRLHATAAISAASCHLRHPYLKVLQREPDNDQYNLCLILTFQEDQSQYMVMSRSTVGESRHSFEVIKQIAPPSLFKRKVKVDNTP